MNRFNSTDSDIHHMHPFNQHLGRQLKVQVGTSTILYEARSKKSITTGC